MVTLGRPMFGRQMFGGQLFGGAVFGRPWFARSGPHSSSAKGAGRSWELDVPGSGHPIVEVAMVQESTYPYLRGGVSAVVHDIICSQPERSFGVVHITWDRSSPHTPLYDVPDNVAWVQPVYLSMQEHRKDFMELTPDSLGLDRAGREQLASDLLRALVAVCVDDCAPITELYDRYMNPRTRVAPLWGLLGSREFMRLAQRHFASSQLPLSDLFWLLREFFSLACAICGHDYPPAKVYHSHTTGYAGLAAALAARQNSARFVLTEHNLYTRDTINYMLDRSMAERIRRSDWQTFEVTAAQRAWMAWLTEMATVTYEAADELTYLYPDALDEALELGSPVDRAVVIPNGIELHRFAEARLRQAERDALRAEQGHVWRFAYVARVVRIKGLLDLLEALAIFAARDVTDFELSVMGHADETPEYLEACKQRCRELGLEDRVHFLGSQNLMKAFGEVDLVLLPSHNEGQPLVILEAMTAGLPTVGTDVGGMMQLLVDPLSEWGATVGPSGIIIQPHDFEAMADSIQRAVENQVLYRAFRANSVERVRHAFQLHQAMDAYSALYDRLIERTGHPEQVIDLTDATSALWADPGWELARASPADGLAPDLAGIAGPHSTPFDAGPGD